jgi:putative protease
LPFASGQIILSLESVVTTQADDFLAASLPALTGKGFSSFIINNISQFYVLQKNQSPRKPLFIAGPYLYTFNRHAAAFAVERGAEFIISPLENSRQNLEKTYAANERGRALITIFCYPPLFRFRANAPHTLRNFTDSQKYAFRLSPLSGDASGSSAVVVPEQPFSIVDKIPFLREAGFRRFVVDFTGKPLKKHIIKEVWKHAQNGVPLRDISRFNWKNGFYTTEKQGAAAD